MKAIVIKLVIAAFPDFVTDQIASYVHAWSMPFRLMHGHIHLNRINSLNRINNNKGLSSRVSGERACNYVYS